MKSLKIFLPILAIFALALAACEDKHDCNGDLDGQWQLLEWRDAKDSVIATKGAFYYSFQLNVMKLQNGNNTDRVPGDASNYFLAHFKKQGDDIVLNDIITYGQFSDGTTTYPSDTKISSTDTYLLNLVSRLGAPSSNHYTIKVLNDDHLVLKSGTTTLTFRKY